jgi:hypothetical protein
MFQNCYPYIPNGPVYIQMVGHCSNSSAGILYHWVVQTTYANIFRYLPHIFKAFGKRENGD